MRSRSSRRRVPTRRSQVAFMRGAWTAVRRILVPAAWKTASKDEVKFDPRSRIRNLMSSNRSSRLRARLRACCTVHSPVGFAVTPPRCIRRVPCSMNTRTCSLLRSTVSTCRKSTATIPAAWACRNCRQPGPERRGAGSMPAECRICHTVDGAIVTPSFVSSPWIRRCPHSGFSLASRTTRRAMPGTFGGRPGLRSPAKAVRLGLNAVPGGEVVGDGAVVAGHGGRGGVDLVDEQCEGAADAGGAWLVELDGDRGGGPGDGAGQAAGDGLAGDGAVLVVVAQVGVEMAR